jgi:hypothetical protein
MATTSKKRWVKDVTTDSTHPPEGLFTKDPETIAKTLASKKVSPRGPASGMRMLNYFINRGGKGLTAARKKELDKAKELLSERIHPDGPQNRNSESVRRRTKQTLSIQKVLR